MTTHAALLLVEPGEEVFLPYTADTLVWHGSSMALLATADALLRQKFRIASPEKDFAKWRTHGGARPYYVAVQETLNQIMSCCLRCLLHGDWEENVDDRKLAMIQNTNEPDATVSHCHRRVVIDFLCTLEEYQNRGYASHLLDLVLQMAQALNANVYVIAHEDACVYWMSKGFILEPQGPIHELLNEYDDSFLLKSPSNRPEDPAFLTSDAPESDLDENEDSDDESDDSSSSSDESDGDDDSGNGDDDDDELQKAIIESLKMG